MALYIKGMEMPTSCSDCRLRVAVGCCGNLPHNTRMPNCPLIHVPPHGRLIDADALHYNRIRIAHNDGTVGGYNAVVMSAEVKDAPTIIPAEESET